MTSLRSPLRRGGTFSLVIALFALLAACSAPADSGTDGSDSAGGGTVAVTDGVVLLSAADLAFDASVIQAPAGAGVHDQLHQRRLGPTQRVGLHSGGWRPNR